MRSQTCRAVIGAELTAPSAGQTWWQQLKSLEKKSVSKHDFRFNSVQFYFYITTIVVSTGFTPVEPETRHRFLLTSFSIWTWFDCFLSFIYSQLCVCFPSPFWLKHLAAMWVSCCAYRRDHVIDSKLPSSHVPEEKRNRKRQTEGSKKEKIPLKRSRSSQIFNVSDCMFWPWRDSF